MSFCSEYELAPIRQVIAGHWRFSRSHVIFSLFLPSFGASVHRISCSCKKYCRFAVSFGKNNGYINCADSRTGQKEGDTTVRQRHGFSGDHRSHQPPGTVSSPFFPWFILIFLREVHFYGYGCTMPQLILDRPGTVAQHVIPKFPR